MSKYNVNGLPWRSGLGKDVTMCETSAEVKIGRASCRERV